MSGLKLPPDGTVKKVSGASLPAALAAAERNALDVEALTHNGNDDLANALGLPITDPICRFPASCFIADDNVGATLEVDEPDNCPEPSGPAFDGTVWYVFQVDRAGTLDVVVDNTTPDTPTPFLAAFEIFNVSTGNGFCGVASDVTTNFGAQFVAGPGTDLGGLVVMAVGARLTGTAGGNYRLNLSWNPDSDGDGLLDSNDRCPAEPGPSGFSGCPDSDGDNISNPDDRCPSQNAGAAGGTYGGCPDADGDGVPEDGSDKCPTLNPNRINRNDRRPRDGCPDILANAAAVVKGVAGTANGIRFDKFTIKRVVSGASVLVTCKLPNGRKCGGLRVRRASASVRADAARNLKVRSLIGKSLPYGTKITVRVTARYATGRFIRIKVVRTTSRISEQIFCMRPGSRKLRKRGCV